MKLSTEGLNWQVSNDKRHSHVGEYSLCQLCTWTTITYVKRASAHLCSSQVLQTNPWAEDGEAWSTCGATNGFCGYHLIGFHSCTDKCLSCSTLQNKAAFVELEGWCFTFSTLVFSCCYVHDSQRSSSNPHMLHTLKGKSHAYTDILVIILSVL